MGTDLCQMRRFFFFLNGGKEGTRLENTWKKFVMSGFELFGFGCLKFANI